MDDRLETLITYLDKLDNVRRHDLNHEMQQNIDARILKVCDEIEMKLKLI